ncbi:MAG: hypothetical protein U9Q03_06035 [Patescibacteria group bacterium]|nr:hypothetical protein [Patescibacteria group bacterium]
MSWNESIVGPPYRSSVEVPCVPVDRIESTFTVSFRTHDGTNFCCQILIRLGVANRRLVTERMLQRVSDIMAERMVREEILWSATESLCQIRTLVNNVCLGHGVLPAEVQEALSGMDLIDLKVLAVAIDSGNGRPMILRLEEQQPKTSSE